MPASSTCATGKGQGAPIDTDLRTFEVRVEDGEILIALPD